MGSYFLLGFPTALAGLIFLGVAVIALIVYVVRESQEELSDRVHSLVDLFEEADKWAVAGVIIAVSGGVLLVLDLLGFH